jgi:hypothetical protein
MSKVLEEYARQRMKEILKEMTAKERMEGIPAEEILRALSPEQRMALETLLRHRTTNDPPKP